MLDLLIVLRHAQFHNHNLHLVSKGPNAQQDHLLAGEFYSALESSYDDLAELMVGLKMALDLPKVTSAAAQDLPAIALNEAGFQHSNELEIEIREEIARLMEDDDNVEDGVQNFLQDLAQQSLARSYKINARLG